MSKIRGPLLLRGLLQQSLGEELVAYFRGRAEKYASLAEASVSAEVQPAMRRPLASLEAMERLLHLDAGSDLAFTDAQLRRVNRLEEAEDELVLRLPTRAYQKSTDSVQTPVVPQLSVWVLAASLGGQVAQLEERFPSWVLRHRSGLLELLVRSLTVYNETQVALVSRFRAVFPNVAF